MVMKIPVLSLLVLLSFGVHGQQGKVLRSPGLKKLDVFVGIWKAENKPGSGAQTTAVTSCRWSENGRFLICDQMVSEATGVSNDLSIYSYDSASNSYFLSLVGIAKTDAYSIPITVRGDTLIYLGSYMDNGQKILNRTLNIFKDPNFYIFISQDSKDGLTWTTTLEGSSRKKSK
jgi:hypothetical protein